MSSGRSLPQINLGVRGGIQGDSHNYIRLPPSIHLPDPSTASSGTHQMWKYTRKIDSRSTYAPHLNDNENELVRM
ncbi:hypothetical protein TNCV_4690891 [Trichonephila clavipes]|nr:hypothetical protein TNCV_4690891 [Trichonephila clavipes]